MRWIGLFGDIIFSVYASERVLPFRAGAAGGKYDNNARGIPSLHPDFDNSHQTFIHTQSFSAENHTPWSENLGSKERVVLKLSFFVLFLRSFIGRLFMARQTKRDSF